jgi:chromosome segregation ATPase
VPLSATLVLNLLNRQQQLRHLRQVQQTQLEQVETQQQAETQTLNSVASQLEEQAKVVQRLAEYIQRLDQRLQENSELIYNFTSQLSTIALEFNSHQDSSQKQVQTFENQLTAHTHQIASVSEQLGETRAKLHQEYQQTAQLLSERLSSVEHSCDPNNIQHQLQQLQQEYQQLVQTFPQLEDHLASVSDQQAQWKTSLTQLKERVAQLEAKLN